MEESKERTTLLESKRRDVISKIKGIAGTFLYVILAAGSRISVQSLDGAVPDFELNSIRCGCATIGMMLYFMVTRSFPWIPRENWMALFLMVVTITVLGISVYVAAAMLPLATAECISVTCFLLSGLVIFTLINKEKLRWDVLLSVPICIVGVTMVIQPEFIFYKQHNQPESKTVQNYILGKTQNHSEPENNPVQNTTLSSVDTNSNHVGTSHNTAVGLIMAVSAGISAVLEVSVVKYYGSFFTVETLSSSLVYSYIAGTFISLVPMFIFEKPTFPTDPKNLFYLSFHCLTYAIITPLILYSSRHLSGNLGLIIRSTVVVLVLTAQYTVLKDIHPGHRNWMEIVGAILVLSGTVASSVVEIARGKIDTSAGV